MSYEVTGGGVRLNTGSSVRISIDNLWNIRYAEYRIILRRNHQTAS